MVDAWKFKISVELKLTGHPEFCTKMCGVIIMTDAAFRYNQASLSCIKRENKVKESQNRNAFASG